MITVNNRPFPYEEGMTVQDVLDKNNYVYEGLIIRVNNSLIEDRSYPIEDGDDIKVIHICQGG